jgi:hypothetical protein
VVSDWGRQYSSMCGCDGPSTTNVAACGACARCRRHRKKKSTAAAMEIAAIPPTTPPAMAPAFEPPVGVDVDVRVGGDVKPWVEDVSVDPVGFGEVRVAPVPVPVVGEPEVPISAPGPISGLSPVAIDLLTFQLFSRVTSRRAHAGTDVPAGTGLGKLEGGSVVVQLNEYSDHLMADT